MPIRKMLVRSILHVNFWASVGMVVLAGTIITSLRMSKRAAMSGSTRAAKTMILPAFEPCLWVALIAGMVRAALLASGPYPAPPHWFFTAVYSDSDFDSSWMLSNACYFCYWFFFEVMADGFGILLLHHSVSKKALRDTLRYTIVVAMLYSCVVTLSYNITALEWTFINQRAVDCVTLMAPAALYLVAMFLACDCMPRPNRKPTPRVSTNPSRSSIILYSGFTVSWRVIQGAAVINDINNTAPGLAIITIRDCMMPLVMYMCLMWDTEYWRELGKQTLVKFEADAKTRRLRVGSKGNMDGPILDVVVPEPVAAPKQGADAGAARGATEATRLVSKDLSVRTPLVPREGLADGLSVAQGDESLSLFLQDPSVMVIDFAFLQTDEIIGRGATSEVYQGKFKQTPVAIKTFRPTVITAAEVGQYAKETGINAVLEHPNIVKYYGLCVSPPTVSLVFELCELGDLYKLLPRARRWSTQGRVKMGIDIARAVAYLHSFSPPYIHRDIKSPNILLAKDYTLKLGDFGEARFLEDEEAEIMTRFVGTPQWMSPEMMDADEYTEKSDVYSTGMVLWELMTGQRPFAGARGTEVIKKVAVDEVRPDIPDSVPPAVAELICRCWHQDPAKRPMADELLADLTRISAELQDAHEEAKAS